MDRDGRRSRRTRARGNDSGAAGGSDGGGRTPEPGTTGRYLVLLRPEAMAEGVRLLSDTVGVKVARSSDFAEGAAMTALADADAVVLDKIGVAVVKGDPRQYEMLAAAGAESPLPIVEPERIVYALQETNGHTAEAPVFEPTPFSLGVPELPFERAPGLLVPATNLGATNLTVDYLEGYRDAIDSLIRRARGAEVDQQQLRVPGIEAALLTETAATWGLQITRVLASNVSGRGVKVAVLDTGMDLRHPDFQGREIVNQSFVPGEPVQDLHGHGTHCIGTACGPRQPGTLPRYGIAYGAEIHAGKVLSNQGRGADGWILAGINWAITRKCKVVSMSLGKATQVGEPFSRIFEVAAKRALALGTLIVAAAGNESERRIGQVAPVGHPANCPSIMAVAAVDINLRLAPFSNGSLNPIGGQVDIAGPGVNVYSTAPLPTRYRRLSGTSMATPHVAGIAALFAEANPNASASGLWRLLTQSARRLSLPSADVGAGLVQATPG